MNGTLSRSILVMMMMMCVGLSTSAKAQAPSSVQKAEQAAQQAGDELAAANSAAESAKALADEATAAAASADQALQAAKVLSEKASAIAAKAGGDGAAAAKASVAKAAEAIKSAEQALAAAKSFADTAVAASRAAEKARADKAAAANRAARKVVAEKAYASAMAVREAHRARAEADKALGQKVEAVRAAATALTAAEKAAANALNDRAAAEKLLAERTAAAKAEAEKIAAAQDEAQKTVLEASAAKAEAQRLEAEKAFAEKASVVEAATQKVGAAKAEVDRVMVEKAAAEQAVQQHVRAIAEAMEAAVVAEVEAIGGLKPLPAAQWDYDKARHLLWRAGFGGPPDEVERLLGMGLQSAVDHLVDYHRRPPCEATFSPHLPERSLAYEDLLEPNEREQLNNERTNRERNQQALMRQWWLRRMAESPRPLEEKLTLFWHDHFATGYEDKLYQTHILYQQNQLFRQFADKFDALLRGIIHDPAMIIYLDNQANVKGRGNENLGREVLELFTLGRDQGYTEQDLRELSRALTGYTFAGNVNQFRFNASQHDEGPKTILGRTGHFSADEAIDIILQHPSTARYIARKLFEYFCHRSPSEEVVDRLAHVLRENHYELGPMLRNLFMSEEFYSEPARAQHIKSPVELMIGTVRALRIANVNWGHVDWEIQNMGMTLFQPPNVGGWEEGRTWISANRIMLRYNGVANLIERPEVDVTGLLEGKASTPEQVVDRLAAACLAIPLRAEQRQQLIDFLGALPPADQWAAQRDSLNARLRALLVLMLSIPEYQVS